MKADHTRKLLGALTALGGLGWIWMSVYPFVRVLFTSDRETSDLVFLFTVVPVMMIPGVLAAVFGVRLFRSMSESSLKWVVGVFAVVAAFWLASRLSAAFPDLLPEDLRHSAFLFVSSLVAIPAYLWVVRLLLRYFSKQDRTCTSLLSRGVLAFMAWQLWLLLTSVFDEFAPIKENSTHIHEQPWETLGLLVPILVAFASYWILASLLPPKAKKNADEPIPQARSST